MSEQVEDQTADGVVGIGGEVVLDAERGEEVVEGALPVDECATVVASHDVGFLAGVGEFADERLEDVFEGDDSAGDTEFVADDSVPELFAAELFEGVVDFELLVEEFSGSDQFSDIEVGIGQVEE